MAISPELNEENPTNIKGKHRETSPKRFGFWLEQVTINSGATKTNPSSIEEDDNLVWLSMPRDYTVDEPNAVIITPTQGGGKFIEDRGGIIYDIMLSGTTGYLPQPSEPTKKPFLQATAGLLPRISDEEALTRSGHTAFLKLRNLFRRYKQIKKYESPDVANNTYLHFLDTKLSDYWVVQPISFNLNQNSRSPMTFNYVIRCKTLSLSKNIVSRLKSLPESKEIKASFSVINAASDGLKNLSPTAIATRINELNQNVRGIIRTSSAFVGQKLGDVLQVFDSFSTLLGLPAFAKNELLALPKSLLSRIANSLFGFEDALASVVSAGDLLTAKTLNEQYLEYRNLYESVASRATTIFGESPQDRLLRESDKYIQRRRLASGEVGSLQTQPFIGQAGLPNSRLDSITGGGSITFRQAVVNKSDTIFSLAMRELGDPNKFVDLIIFNGLSHPWISDDNGTKLNRQPGVLFPGDKVLIPVKSPNTSNVVEIEFVNTGSIADRVDGTLTAVDLGTNTFTDNTQSWLPGQWVGYTVTIGTDSRIIIANDATTFTVSRAFVVAVIIGSAYEFRLNQFMANNPLTPVEAVFGRDILGIFTFGSSGFENSVSCVLNGTGDLATITGVENYIQAQELMLATEQGRNIFHPLYGVPLTVGSRAQSQKIDLYRFLVDRAISSDPRTGKVESVDISYSGGVLNPTIAAQPVAINTNTVIIQLAS